MLLKEFIRAELIWSVALLPFIIFCFILKF